jgi:hypothetical protein
VTAGNIQYVVTTVVFFFFFVFFLTCANVARQTGWDLDGDNEDYPGRTELISYLSFLNYVDQLVRQAHPVIAEALADHLAHQFFPEVVQPRQDGGFLLLFPALF